MLKNRWCLIEIAMQIYKS